MIDFTISPETIERFRASVKAFETLKLGEYRIPIIIDPLMAAGAIGIAAMSPLLREQYEECRRNELALSNAVFATGKPAHEIRAMAARSPLPFDVFCAELLHDQNQTHNT